MVDRHGGPVLPEGGEALVERLRGWARELGFSQIGVADVNLSHAEAGLMTWLANGFHGSMDYMAAHGPLEQVATLHLDLKAAESGYESLLPSHRPA